MSSCEWNHGLGCPRWNEEGQLKDEGGEARPGLLGPRVVDKELHRYSQNSGETL